MAIIYMISSFFRRGSTPTPPPSEDGAVATTSYMYTTNLFDKGTYLVRYRRRDINDNNYSNKNILLQDQFLIWSISLFFLMCST